MNINNYPLEASQINDEDFYDVDYWTGVAYESRKISGANLKALLGQDATTAKREIVQFINKTGSALSEGTIVYLKTSSSSSEYPEVELADASTEITSSKTIGAVYATVANDDIGIIVTSGEVDNLDTSMYNIGDRLWLSTTAGEVTTTAPVSPDHAVFIGIVTRAQNGNGRILYRIQNGYELGELHDVLLDTPPTDGDVLTYDSVTGLWKNEAGGGGGSAIPQTDVIYVDSVLGADNGDADRGNIEKPYATVEYVLANVTNTGTITGNTTSGSATISSVSDTSNIKVGQFITGTNIPYNSIVVSKTSNTIVLSQTATGTGSTITFTWWTPKTIKINGNIVATSNWFKAGFWFDCGDANITWSNFNLFNKTTATLVPEIINGGNWFGNHASSVFISQLSVASAHDIFINIQSYISIGTGTQINLSGTGSFLTLSINCQSFNAKFGTIANLRGTNVSWSGYKYGLLGGLYLNNSSSIVNDTTECPSSVLAISSTSGSNLTVNGTVYGSVDTRGMLSRVNFNSGVIGTTIGCGTNVYDAHVFASVYRQTITVAGNAIFNFVELATINQSTGTLIVHEGNASYTGTGGIYVLNGYHRYDFVNSFTLSGTCQVFLNNDCAKGLVSVGSGTTLTINGKYRGQFGQHNGTVTVSKGAILEADRSTGTNYRITGTMNIFGTVQLLRSYGAEVNESVTPTLPLSTGTIIVDSGTIVCGLANSLSGLITKYGTGGVVVLKGQCYLKAANGLAPLYIKSNTGTSQDIFDFSMVGNGASGFRLADTFSDTTYGTAYAPNLLVGGVHYQDTTYSF